MSLCDTNLSIIKVIIDCVTVSRMGDFKLIEGFPGLYDGWYPPMNETRDTPLMSNVWRPNDTRVWLFNVRGTKLFASELSVSVSCLSLGISLFDRERDVAPW